MPIIKSAKKRVKTSKRNRARNLKYLSEIRKKRKEIKSEKTDAKRKKLISEYYSLVDKAQKKNVIHKNKAARMKSRFIKSLKEDKSKSKEKKKKTK